MNVIPLQPVAAQNLSILLGGQNCQISIAQKGDFLYLSLAVNNTSIVSSMICRDRVRLVRYAYTGFSGNLVFIDTVGTSDPEYTGLGSRYELAYMP